MIVRKINKDARLSGKPVYEYMRAEYMALLKVLCKNAEVEHVITILGGLHPPRYSDLNSASLSTNELECLIGSASEDIAGTLTSVMRIFDLGTELCDSCNRVISLSYDAPLLDDIGVTKYDTPIKIEFHDGHWQLRTTRQITLVRDGANAIEINARRLTGIRIEFTDEYSWLLFRSVKSSSSYGQSMILLTSILPAPSPTDDNIVIIPMNTVIGYVRPLDPDEAF